MINNLLVVCIGNICRSPIGEALFAHHLATLNPTIAVSSAGLGALVNHSADTVAQELMQLKGIDISQHRARQINAEILFDSDLVLTMTADQQQAIEAQYPSMRGRVHRLGKWGGFDVPDPYKRPRQIFDQALALIEQGVNDWLAKVWKC